MVFGDKLAKVQTRSQAKALKAGARVGGDSADKASKQHALLHGCSQASSSASKLTRRVPSGALFCFDGVLKLDTFVRTSVCSRNDEVPGWK